MVLSRQLPAGDGLAEQMSALLSAREELEAETNPDEPARVMESLRDFGSVAIEGAIDPAALSLQMSEWDRFAQAYDALIATFRVGSHQRLWMLLPALAGFATGLEFDDHGAEHLRQVAATALMLANVTDRAHKAVAVAFGLFHDLMREATATTPTTGSGPRTPRC